MSQGRKESSDRQQCVESGAGFWGGFCRSFIVSTFSCNNPTSIVSNVPSKIMPNYYIVPHSRGKGNWRLAAIFEVGKKPQRDINEIALILFSGD